MRKAHSISGHTTNLASLNSEARFAAMYLARFSNISHVNSPLARLWYNSGKQTTNKQGLNHKDEED